MSEAKPPSNPKPHGSGRWTIGNAYDTQGWICHLKGKGCPVRDIKSKPDPDENICHGCWTARPDPDQKSGPGYWYCSVYCCGMNNMPSHDECVRCLTPKDGRINPEKFHGGMQDPKTFRLREFCNAPNILRNVCPGCCAQLPVAYANMHAKLLASPSYLHSQQ